MSKDLTDYYSKIGYLRGAGLDESRAYGLAEEAMSQEETEMSRHAKKMKRIADWEGSYPEIGVSEAWLYWNYCVVVNARRVVIRVEIPLEEDGSPWLYVDGNAFHPDFQLTWEEAEARYGTKTRVQLLETHRAAVLEHAVLGLAALREAATARGLYGQLEGQVR